jgi:hypothetical protein
LVDAIWKANWRNGSRRWLSFLLIGRLRKQPCCWSMELKIKRRSKLYWIWSSKNPNNKFKVIIIKWRSYLQEVNKRMQNRREDFFSTLFWDHEIVCDVRLYKPRSWMGIGWLVGKKSIWTIEERAWRWSYDWCSCEKTC